MSSGSQPPPTEQLSRVETEKREAAEAAAREIRDGDAVGLGTGTTVGFFLEALARRRIHLRCVATSPATETAARELGLVVEPFTRLDALDVAVDGADQLGPGLWLVKGGGGAQTREKVVAAAAKRFLVIVSSDKLVSAIGPPVPLEALAFGLGATLRLLTTLGPVRRRPAPLTPDGNVLLNYMGRVGDPAILARELDAVPGIVGHGLFPPAMVTEVFVGRSGRVSRLRYTGRPHRPVREDSL